MPPLARSVTVFMGSPHLEVGYLRNICSERHQVDWPLEARKSNYLFPCRGLYYNVMAYPYTSADVPSCGDMTDPLA